MDWGTRNKEFVKQSLAIDSWQSYYHRNQQEYIRRRLRAIRMFAEGNSRQKISQALGITYKTLSTYLDVYIQGGLAALVSPIRKPRAKRLTDQQQSQLKDIILTQQPEDFSKKEPSGH
jgi:transposase